MTTRTANDLTDAELAHLREHMLDHGHHTVGKIEVTEALETIPGFPRWQHGKQYAKTQAGKTLDLMRKADMVAKSGKTWTVLRPVAEAV